MNLSQSKISATQTKKKVYAFVGSKGLRFFVINNGIQTGRIQIYSIICLQYMLIEFSAKQMFPFVYLFVRDIFLMVIHSLQLNLFKCLKVHIQICKKDLWLLLSKEFHHKFYLYEL